MGFYQNLQKACQSHNTTISALLTKCGFGKSYGTYWKKGKYPTLDIAAGLAEELNISIDYLLYGDEFKISLEQQNLINDFEQLSDTNKQLITQHIQALIELQENEDIVTIKHSIYKVSAGFGEALYDADNFEDIKIRNNDIAQIADFALTVYGDSMVPKYYPDDVVLIKQQDSVDIGDICVYIVQNEGFIKRFEGDKLVSLNPKYDDILFKDYSNDEIRCCGVVLGKAQVVS